MDFAFIMFVVLCVTGFIWLFDHVAIRATRDRDAQALARAGAPETDVEKARKEPVYVEYARAFFPVILIVFLLRSFLVEPFRIPSGSMLPSLLVGDFILVNKFTYGVRLPVINKKVIDIRSPRRGDVVVFRFPKDPSINYIKRVVGLPGDRVMYSNKKVYVNGQAMNQHDPRSYADARPSDCAYMAQRLTEQLDKVEHDILVSDRSDHRAMTFSVPDGHYFVLGDNRDCSNDSRFWKFVPDENLVGRAFLVWFNADLAGDQAWGETIKWYRIGESID